MNTNRERRAFIRVELPVPCTVNFDSQTFLAECLNISATGMCIALNEGQLSVGDVIQIKLGEENDAELPALDAQARVVRVIDDNTKKYGIQFLSNSME